MPLKNLWHNMNKAEIIYETEKYVQSVLEGDGSGHDWWHIDQVRKHALKIAQAEKDSDQFIVEMAALLHDIADHKAHNGDYEIGEKTAREWLSQFDLDEQQINEIAEIVGNISFSKGGEPMHTKEGMIVQDADRLEALGAIGVARCFAYGGNKQRLIYDPLGRDQSTSIQHFYDKLLKVKDFMNTEMGSRLAKERHQFLESFLEQFYAEWEGNK